MAPIEESNRIRPTVRYKFHRWLNAPEADPRGRSSIGITASVRAALVRSISISVMLENQRYCEVGEQFPPPQAAASPAGSGTRNPG